VESGQCRAGRRFAASKAALQELADSLRAEETGNGLSVTTIYPGATATGGLREVRAAFGRDYDPARCIQPDTLAAMVSWVLAAPPDAYITELSVAGRAPVIRLPLAALDGGAYRGLW